jgi:hypothetical protein
VEAQKGAALAWVIGYIMPSSENQGYGANSSFDVLYAVAAAERLGAADDQLILIRQAYEAPIETRLEWALSPSLTLVMEAVAIIAGRWTEEGTLSPEVKGELNQFPTDVVEALEWVGQLIQPLPWPEKV